MKDWEFNKCPLGIALTLDERDGPERAFCEVEIKRTRRGGLVRCRFDGYAVFSRSDLQGIADEIISEVERVQGANISGFNSWFEIRCSMADCIDLAEFVLDRAELAIGSAIERRCQDGQD